MSAGHPRRAVVIGAAAVLLGLAVATVALLYAMAPRPLPLEPEPVTVLVAVRDIAAGTPVEEAVSVGLVEERELTADKIQVGAVSGVESLRGLVAVAPIDAGQQLRVGQWGPAGSASSP